MFDPDRDRESILKDSQTMTYTELAMKYDCHVNTISRYMKDWDRKPKCKLVTYKDEVIVDSQTMTVSQLAVKYGASVSAVRSRLKEWRTKAVPEGGNPLTYDDDRLIRGLVTSCTMEEIAEKLELSIETIRPVVLDEIDRLTAMLEGMDVDISSIRSFLAEGRVSKTTVLTRHRRPCYVVIPYDEWVKRVERNGN